MIEIQEIYRHLKLLEKDEEYIGFFNYFADNNLRSNPEFMKEIIEKVIDISKRLKYKIAYGYGLNYMGWYHHDRAEYDKAIEYHIKAKDIFEENKCENGLIKVYNGLLADYTRIGYLETAIEYGLKGIDIANEYNNMAGYIMLSVNTMVSYFECKYYEEAYKIAQNLINIPYEIKPESKIIIYSTMAEIHLINKELELAKKYVKISQDISSESGSGSCDAEILIIIAEIYFEEGSYESMEDTFSKALKIAEDTNDINTVIMVLLKWANCEKRINKYDSSEDKLVKAFKYAEETNSKMLLRDICLELSDLYKKCEKYKEACDFQQKYIDIKEKLLESDNKYIFMEFNNKNTIQQASLYKRLYSQMQTISEIGKKLTSDLSLESILEVIYKEINKLVLAEVVGIAIYNEKDMVLDYKLFVDRGKRVDLGIIDLLNEESFGKYSFDNREFIRINDAEIEYKKYVPKITSIKNRDKNNTAKSLIFSPLIVEDSCIGLLTVQSYKKDAYTVEDCNTIKTICSYLAIAIENACLFNEVEYMATHDNLTDLINRKKILQYGEEQLKEIESKKLSIVISDIDFFKRINDTYGHLVGDEILKNISKIIKSSVRKNDLVARYGGEEFLIIFPGTSEIETYAIVERIRQKIQQSKYKYNESTEVMVTISSGVYEFKENYKSFYEGINFADMALYKAKELGRNNTIIYDKILG